MEFQNEQTPPLQELGLCFPAAVGQMSPQVPQFSMFESSSLVAS